MSGPSMLHEFKLLMTVQAYPAFLAFRTIRGFSGWIQVALAYPVLVYHFGASPAMLGVAVFLTGIPFIVLGPWLGGSADRRSPIAMMAVGSAYRVAGLVALGWAPSIEIFIVVMFFNAVAGSASAAEPVVLSRLLADEQIRSATSIGGFLDLGTKLVAPLIGVAIAWMGEMQRGYYLLAFMAALSLVCALMLGRTVGWASPAAPDRPK